jgi:hypothetical protein
MKKLQHLILYLALIFICFLQQESLATTNVIINGGFESGNFSGWVTGNRYNEIMQEGRSVDGTDILLTSPIEDSWFARLGRWDSSYSGYNPSLEPGGYDWMYQDVAVPLGSPTLAFSYNILTYDTAAWDWLDVFIKDPSNDVVLATVVSHDGKPGYEYGPYYNCWWKYVNFDMSYFAGRTVRIWFGVRQDNYGDQTAAWIDNIFLSGGSFGKFDPNEDGYKFINYGNDLSGWSDNDRWDAFKYAFGPEYCEFLDGQHRTAAQTFFDDHKKDVLDGHCFGFSASSLMFFTKEWDVTDSSFVGANVTKVVDIPIYTGLWPLGNTNEKIAKQIEAKQWSQYGYDDLYYPNDPKGICEWLEENFAAEISIWDKTADCWLLCGTGGHSIVPLKTELTSNTCKIYVYDSNHPKDSERYMNVDLQNNTWSYTFQKFLWWDFDTWSGGAADTFTSIGLRKYSDLKGRPKVPFAPEQGDFDFAVCTGTSATTIQDSLFRRIGFVNGSFVNEIPGAAPIFISSNGSNTESLSQDYFLPAGNQYTMYATGLDSGTYTLTYYAPRGFFRVETTSVPGSIDTLNYDAQNRAGIFSTDNADKSIRLLLVNSVPNLTSERLFEVNMNSVLGVKISENMPTDLNSLAVHMEGLSSLSTYGLRITQGGLGSGEVSFSNIPILPGDTQIVTPENWNDLAHTTVKLQVDHGSDGVIDEVWTLLSNQTPVADANGPYSGTVGSLITFDASGSYDPDGTIVLYEWDWDDNGTYDESTTSTTINHTWSSPYSGTVRLRVTDNDGLTAIDTASVAITIPGDLDGDGDVDADDYLIFRTAYGSCTGGAKFISRADLDSDGCITINDYRIMRSLVTP